MSASSVRSFLKAGLHLKPDKPRGQCHRETRTLVAAPKNISIAYSVDVLDETQNVALQFMLDRVKVIKAERDDIHVTFDVYDARNSVDKQLSDVFSRF